MTRVLIRTHLSRETGMGHAVRCRALAQVLKAHGAEVSFVTSTPALCAFVVPFPCFVRLVRYAPVSMDSVGSDIVVIDANADELSVTWMGELRRRGARVVWIDKADVHPDAADLVVLPGGHYAPTVLNRYEALLPGRVLSGWDYVMLDPAVTAQPPMPYSARVDGPIVVCAGGSDPEGALLQMYHWGAYLDINAPMVFLVGQHATHVPMASDSHMRKYASVEPFARRWLQHAALVVGMFGISVYESLFWRTPVVAFARTGDDALCLERLASAGCLRLPCAPTPLFQRITHERFCATIEASMDRKVRDGMHVASADLIDGHGTARVADAIMALAEKET